MASTTIKKMRKQSDDNEKYIGNSLKEIRINKKNFFDNFPEISSALGNISSKIDSDATLREAFFLGLVMSQYGLYNTDNTVKPIRYENINSHEQFTYCTTLRPIVYKDIHIREWRTFNDNIVTLLDACSIPITIKEETKSFNEIIETIDIYYPEQFYPKVHVQKKILGGLQINDIKDVIMFNHQFKLIFNHFINCFEKSPLYEKICSIDIENMATEIQAIGKEIECKPNKINRIYNKEFDGSKLISIDIIQANATIFFVYFGKKLFMEQGLEIKDMGLGLEMYFSSWEDFFSKFNWSYYIRSQLSTIPPEKKIVDDSMFDKISNAFIGSKMAREIIMGVTTKKKINGKNYCLEKILELTCHKILYHVIKTIQPIMKLFNATIVSFTMDEITIKELDYSTLISLLSYSTTSLIGDTCLIKKYLRIEEFILQKHTLENGKFFYAKYYTDESIPSIKYVTPENKIAAIDIINTATTLPHLATLGKIGKLSFAI